SGGMCPVCEGRGSISDFALEELYNPEYSLADGGLKVPGYSMDGWYGRLFRAAGLDLHKPIIDYTDAELDLLLYREPLKVQFRSEEHTSELQSRFDLVCRLLLEKKKLKNTNNKI